MRASSLGFAITRDANHVPVRPNVTPPALDVVIEYEYARANVRLNRIVLACSVAVTMTIVCFNVVFIAYN